MQKRKEGAERGIRLIKKQSLLDYLDRQAAGQSGLRWADHILNPDNLTIDDVVADQDTFHHFLGLENEISDQKWEVAAKVDCAISSSRLRDCSPPFGSGA